MSRKGGGRGIANIEYCVDVSIRVLEDFIKKSKEKLITAASNTACNITTNVNATKSRK